jgi:hypothetical protein
MRGGTPEQKWAWEIRQEALDKAHNTVQSLAHVVCHGGNGNHAKN